MHRRQTRLNFSYLEQQIADLDGQMAQDASDHTLLLQHATEKEKLEATLSHKMERWVYLHDLSEKIQAQK